MIFHFHLFTRFFYYFRYVKLRHSITINLKNSNFGAYTGKMTWNFNWVNGKKIICICMTLRHSFKNIKL